MQGHETTWGGGGLKWTLGRPVGLPMVRQADKSAVRINPSGPAQVACVAAVAHPVFE